MKHIMEFNNAMVRISVRILDFDMVENTLLFKLLQ